MSKARTLLDALYAELEDAKRQANRRLPIQSFELCRCCKESVHEVEARCSEQEAQRRIELAERLIGVLVP